MTQAAKEASEVSAKRHERIIALVGTPNVGKSVVFSLLTGKYANVSNYPGTTVEVYRGAFLDGKVAREVVDTPGVTSLVPRSEDESVARDILLAGRDTIVLQIADAKNLERNLVLTTQLAELGLPMVLAVNMIDEAGSAGISVKTDLLSELVGVPVVATAATEKRGIAKLIQSVEAARPPHLNVHYDAKITQAVAKIVQLLPSSIERKEALALMLLSDDPPLKARLHHQYPSLDMEEIDRVIRNTQKHFRRPLSYVINWSRRQTVQELLTRTVRHDAIRIPSVSEWLGNIAQHPVFGVPLLLIILYLVKVIAGDIGAGICVDFIETTVFGKFINPGAVWLAQHVVPWQWLQELLVGEFGLVTMGLTYAIAIVLPVVGFFFIIFGILEDTGYLPRLAVMVNKIFRAMGLSGKAVLPLVLGLGCDTMATLTARILDTKKERIIATLLLALAIPCSAQLGVILGILGEMSGSAFAVYVGVIVMQLFVVGFAASKILPGGRSDFLLDIPPFRIPRLGNLVAKTLYRLAWYLKEAVPLFLLGTFVLFLFDKLHLLAAIEHVASPIVTRFLGLPQKATQAFIMGFLRRDYGAAGINALFEQDMLTIAQTLVSLVVITLFVPCIANVFVIIKEQGLAKAAAIVSFVFAYAIVAGGVFNFVLHLVHFGT